MQTEEQKELERLLKRLNVYGLTQSDFIATLDAQGDQCPICEEPLIFAESHSIHFDHCHQTQAFRGLLCNGCNKALGRIERDTELARRQMERLQRQLAYLANPPTPVVTTKPFSAAKFRRPPAPAAPEVRQMIRKVFDGMRGGYFNSYIRRATFFDLYVQVFGTKAGLIRSRFYDVLGEEILAASDVHCSKIAWVLEDRSSSTDAIYLEGTKSNQKANCAFWSDELVLQYLRMETSHD